MGGNEVFEERARDGDHVRADAPTSGVVGPLLDRVLRGRDEGFSRESIVDPNAEIEKGYEPGVMPQDFDEKLSDGDLHVLVKYLLEAAKA